MSTDKQSFKFHMHAYSNKVKSISFSATKLSPRTHMFMVKLLL